MVSMFDGGMAYVWPDMRGDQSEGVPGPYDPDSTVALSSDRPREGVGSRCAIEDAEVAARAALKLVRRSQMLVRG
ncbi:hypothetical protein Tdes44962_MAKER02923 [Teratosphaeria destructans]|uniref:Uncharacterized protein n=1 Tax=Teratosphaeria destructans TaxID=418781 RepID=A0A9W7SRK2_9PEZI|nr:hypothetical protein Tdes44962_MAKER02923 [Teratosphaeria destructans]